MLTAENILIYLVAINLVTYFAYGMDKKAAINGHWRIPEKNLFILAILGGTPAAFFAARKFRHKNKKFSFRAKMWFILMTQVFALYYLYFFYI